MKKLFVSTLLITALLGGCSNDSQSDNSNGNSSSTLNNKVSNKVTNFTKFDIKLVSEKVGNEPFHNGNRLTFETEGSRIAIFEEGNATYVRVVTDNDFDASSSMPKTIKVLQSKLVGDKWVEKDKEIYSSSTPLAIYDKYIVVLPKYVPDAPVFDYKFAEIDSDGNYKNEMSFSEKDTPWQDSFYNLHRVMSYPNNYLMIGEDIIPLDNPSKNNIFKTSIDFTHADDSNLAYDSKKKEMLIQSESGNESYNIKSIDNKDIDFSIISEDPNDEERIILASSGSTFLRYSADGTFVVYDKDVIDSDHIFKEVAKKNFKIASPFENATILPDDVVVTRNGDKYYLWITKFSKDLGFGKDVCELVKYEMTLN